MAVDINTLYNPYHKIVKNEDGTQEEVIEPATGKDYLDRTKDFDYKIEKDEGQEPLLKETVQPVSFTGMPEAIHDLPATLEYSIQSDRQPLTVLEVDKFISESLYPSLYAIST